MESNKESKREKPSAQPTSPKGISINIGLNRVDPVHYDGWSGQLTACEFDARDLYAIAQQKGFTSTLLLTANATAQAVLDALSDAANNLYGGDIVLLTYSGHGSQVPDTNSEEVDDLDETWVLYDRQLVDDELFAMFSQFRAGVRIFVLSDSCHSGTVTKEIYYTSTASRRETVDVSHGATPIRYRAMPQQVALRTYRANKAHYDKILKSINADVVEDVKATVLLISGCQDNQLSSDGAFNGLFTASLLRVWNGGKFRGDYRKFHENIVKVMPPDQTPNYFLVGMQNKPFETQQPFTV